ncbi:Putative peroxiredoxin bcp [Roseimaritima multifibrata]|uniref:thioredoxin-dependent peroxiredoxin n=1 Tax=Roseimaritima multifibrata TaxID=1930274 RepID=A0A517MJ89_9BACT|nr:peroxiredoxin-like family protein [Roseimaritima multifibrata]QDS94966.1 Putative peroxiredoxin bcp [Roseimaritima multifibrata]
MTTLRDQTNAQFAKLMQSKPAFANLIESLLAKARDFGDGKDAIAVGQPAPNFDLPNAIGESVELSALLAGGPVVLMFYRGSWCPYCNLQLRAMQARLADIEKLGGQLVAVSPEIPDESLSLTERAELKFTVLSDKDALIAAQYGVAWKVPEPILDHMRNDRGLDLAKINDGNATVLPIPATFVISADGIVTWQYVNVDYRHRAEPDDVIAALLALK